MIYPKPIAYYLSADFLGDRGSVVPSPWAPERLAFFANDPILRQRLTSQLRVAKFRRSGRLMGEYVVFNNGCIALDRSGAIYKINHDADDDFGHFSTFKLIEEFCFTPDFQSFRDHALENWDQIDSLGESRVLSEWHSSNNYYHFTIKLLPQLRLAPDLAETSIGMPEELFTHPFQQQLMQLTLGRRQVRPMPLLTRVTNPQLWYEPFTPDALQWLQSKVGHMARRGERRIFITRGKPMGVRKGGTPMQTPELAEFLETHGFETVNFGSGEIPVTEQIRMLDGARVILSTHGANLTNIAYCEPGISVIELLPWHWGYYSHMEISLAAGLNHAVIVCDDFDTALNMRINIGQLTQAYAFAMDATASRAVA